MLGTRMFRVSALLLSSSLASCTQQLPESIKFLQQEQTFNAQQRINNKVDLLWVVDNSGSMDVSQERLRQGFAGFASKYMRPSWDIRVAVITTDTFIANPAFSNYLGRTISGSVGYIDPYIQGRLATWQNPVSNPTLVNLSTGAFTNGVKFRDLNPLWGPTYAKLLPGNHDGPVTALCTNLFGYFMRGVSQCSIRDDQTQYNGTSGCVNPNTAAGESGLTQCVNTVQNNTVRSGKPIISTRPPEGVAADSAWTQQLVRDFMVNLSTGSSGSGSERGLASLLQFISDNEPGDSSTAFFRSNSIRGIIFISDEEDQSMALPSPIPAGFDTTTYYKCDQASLLLMNAPARITGAGGYCCASGCQYGSEGLSCPQKSVDGYNYAVSTCPVESRLIAVSDVKDQLDTLFNRLDGDQATSNSYFVTSIVASSGSSIQQLQAARDLVDAQVGINLRTHAIDRADRYIALSNLVGSGSSVLDIGASDYSPLLDSIGAAIVRKASYFTLDRQPSSEVDMIVKIRHGDGSETIIPREFYEVEGRLLMITDVDTVLGFVETDSIVINYQPRSAF